MTGEDLNEKISDFFGRKAIDSNSYWIPEKIFKVNYSDSKIHVLIFSENGSLKYLSLDVIYSDDVRFEESNNDYQYEDFTLIWEE